MSGGGNDFVAFDNRGGWFPKDDPELVRAICARGLGVGADAVLLLEEPMEGRTTAPSSDAPHPRFRMLYYNADGSEASMCGNGALCIARLALELGMGGEGWVAFQTGAGTYRAKLDPASPERVWLSMRDPHSLVPRIPDIEARGYTHVGFIDTGTPHLVVLVPDVRQVDVEREGAALRGNALFKPEGLNVNFVAVLNPHELDIRTYERGVEAETLSCGTGGAAAAMLGHLWGLTASPVTVHPPSGCDLRVAFDRTDAGFARLELEGDARIVFSAKLSA
jgi:diaminopimelate epimerase